jgi:transmembrane sensor
MTARSNIDETVLDQAIAWQLALGGEDADWDGYVEWLEADPRHREAFDSIAIVAAAVEEHKADVRTILDARMPTPRPGFLSSARLLWGGAVAAALALFVTIPALWSPRQVAVTYQAEPGKNRSIALANGTNVILSPSSSIVVRGKDAHAVELASGEAYFDVKHDPRRALTVSAGDYRITDIGTRFSVSLSDGTFRVGVSDGIVTVTSPQLGQEVQVSAGHQLVNGGRALTLSPVATAEIGSWRAGRLSYTDAPLRLVAADISRYSGRTVVVDPSLEKNHFSGTLVIGDGSRLPADLATILSAGVRQEGNVVRIGPAGTAR